MVTSRDQNAGQSRRLEIDTSLFERDEQSKRLGTNLRNQNSVQEEIKSRLKSGNACYHSVQNLLPSSLISKNVYKKTEMYRTIKLRVGVKLGRAH